MKKITHYAKIIKFLNLSKNKMTQIHFLTQI